MAMYEKDKNTRITLRVNAEQYAFIREMAETSGISPSDYLRQSINSQMYAIAKFKDILEKNLNERGERVRENEQTDINSKL